MFINNFYVHFTYGQQQKYAHQSAHIDQFSQYIIL